MYWKYPETDLERHLSALLNRRIQSCTHKSAGPELARLHSVEDFVAELEHGGVQLEGFTTTRREECSNRLRPKSVHTIYTITCDALPASECFVCIECGSVSATKLSSETGECYSSPVQFYARLYDAMMYYGQTIYDNDFGFVFRFLERFEEIASEVPLIRAKFQKQRKIKELTQDSIKAWFVQICEELGCPYFIEVKRVQSKLYVRLNEKTQLEIVVPHATFQKVMPELSGIIQTYTALFESTKARVLMSNVAPGNYWREPGKKQDEGKYEDDDDEDDDGEV
ncbi:MAG: hypothetical protein LBJ41_02715 [Treponema sp.]|jgi:hypothetical protein|nr:hypothetical protein [Treponema sp.]